MLRLGSLVQWSQASGLLRAEQSRALGVWCQLEAP